MHLNWEEQKGLDAAFGEFNQYILGKISQFESQNEGKVGGPCEAAEFGLYYVQNTSPPQPSGPVNLDNPTVSPCSTSDTSSDILDMAPMKASKEIHPMGIAAEASQFWTAWSRDSRARPSIYG